MARAAAVLKVRGEIVDRRLEEDRVALQKAVNFAQSGRSAGRLKSETKRRRVLGSAPLTNPSSAT